MSVKQISPEEANQLMERNAEMVYIDVRTEPEFEQGHPPNAINIPVVLPDTMTGKMTPNPDFIEVVEAHIGKDKSVIMGCQMGGRSQYASELMVSAGYEDISNMQGGFGGARDPMGQLIGPGWLQMGYPVEERVDDKNSYQGLKRDL